MVFKVDVHAHDYGLNNFSISPSNKEEGNTKTNLPERCIFKNNSVQPHLYSVHEKFKMESTMKLSFLHFSRPKGVINHL